MKTVTTTDYNSNKNQNIKGEFVRKNVIVNLNQIMSFIQESEYTGDWEDELMNLYYSPDYQTAVENEGWIYDAKNEVYTNDEFEGEEFETAEEIVNDKNYDYDYNEAYEFWAVSDFLMDRLKEEGETVVELLGFNVWARGTTGQAILLDYCISKVCEGMEILEGQPNEWN